MFSAETFTLNNKVLVQFLKERKNNNNNVTRNSEIKLETIEE